MNGRLTNLELGPNGIAVLTMRDPARKNALSQEMVQELEERAAALAHNNNVKTVILAGLDEYFSTGANREVLEKIIAGKVTPRDLLLPRVMLDLPVPVISAMAGHAIGGGLALGVCADVTVIARESRYGASFINYGFTPGMGLTRLLEHVLGSALANEMLLTGKAFRGSHFEGRGFNYVLPQKDVMTQAFEIASLLVEKPRTSLVTLKLALSSTKRELFEAARTTECLMHQITFLLPDVERLIEEMLE
jgi:polyketide biosynthesis enoyl-CoA hydratase PksI